MSTFFDSEPFRVSSIHHLTPEVRFKQFRFSQPLRKMSNYHFHLFHIIDLFFCPGYFQNFLLCSNCYKFITTLCCRFLLNDNLFSPVWVPLLRMRTFPEILYPRCRIYTSNQNLVSGTSSSVRKKVDYVS